jgi:hypothetical protein
LNDLAFGMRLSTGKKAGACRAGPPCYVADLPKDAPAVRAEMLLRWRIKLRRNPAMLNHCLYFSILLVILESV